MPLPLENIKSQTLSQQPAGDLSPSSDKIQLCFLSFFFFSVNPLLFLVRRPNLPMSPTFPTLTQSQGLLSSPLCYHTIPLARGQDLLPALLEPPLERDWGGMRGRSGKVWASMAPLQAMLRFLKTVKHGHQVVQGQVRPPFLATGCLDSGSQVAMPDSALLPLAPTGSRRDRSYICSPQRGQLCLWYLQHHQCVLTLQVRKYLATY